MQSTPAHHKVGIQVHPKNHYYCLFLTVYFTWDPKVSVRTHPWNVLNHDWDARKQLSKEDHPWWPMSTWAETMPAQGDPALLEPCVRAPVTPEVARAGGGTWSTNAWASGELMAPWCYAPKAVPAFTLAAGPADSSWRLSSPKCSKHTVPEEMLVHYSHQQYGHWCVQAEYHQQVLHGPALALGLGAAAASLQVQQNWLWALCWHQHSQHLLGCRQGSTLPWLPPNTQKPLTHHRDRESLAHFDFQCKGQRTEFSFST